MSDKVVLTAEPRSDVGKRATRRLRRRAMVPAIIYGGEGDPRMISLSYRELKVAMQSEAFFSQVLSVQVDGDREETIVKDLQRHPSREEVMHIDFRRVVAGQIYHVHVPLHFLGDEECKGVKLGGGNLLHQMNEIEIAALPQDLPEYLEVDVRNLDLGESLHLSEVPLPSGVRIPALELGEDHDQPVATVAAPRSAREIAAAATPEGEEAEALEPEAAEEDAPEAEAEAGGEADPAGEADAAGGAGESEAAGEGEDESESGGR